MKRMNQLQGKFRNVIILNIQSLVEWSHRSLVFFIRKRVITSSGIPSLPQHSPKVQYSQLLLAEKSYEEVGEYVLFYDVVSSKNEFLT